MLTFEKVLEIFADYLTADETIEVYISRHGCVRVEFDQDFHYCSGEVCHTPKELFVLVLTLFVWLCTGLIYISGLVLGLLSTVIALLGVAVLITYSPQNGVILLVMAFLISPMGLPLAAIWLLGKVQSLKFAIQDWVYG